jgi:SAM-dependent methyltransferase/methyltransferase-like protein
VVLGEASFKDNLVMIPSQSSTYDQLPYTRYAFPQTHPDRLASIGMVYGVMPPDVHSCRVLEIGCGRGGNLIPMAEQLPGGHFVGVDLSRVQIEEAKAWALDLGFSNIDLRQMDILDIDASLGMFDYIVCHGVFSWVPLKAQQAILRICRENLVPNGIATISYNTKPGWNYRGSLRDAMLFRASQFERPAEKLVEAKKLLELLAKELKGEQLHEKLLLQEMEALKGKDDSYVYHEYLEECNFPFYFHEFTDQLGPFGLQYLGEADLSLPFGKANMQALTDAFESLSDSYLQLEQYSDFVTGRMFRQSLICHQEQVLSRNYDPNILQRFRLESLLEPCLRDETQGNETQPQLSRTSDSSIPFRYKHTGTMVQLDFDNQLVESAFHVLSEVGNGGCSFAWLFSEAVKRCASISRMGGSELQKLQSLDAVQSLQIALIRAALSGGLWLHTIPASHTLSVSAKPRASKIARSQAAAGERVTTLQHRSVELNSLDRWLLCNLDGCNTIGQLVDLLREAMKDQQDRGAMQAANTLEFLKSRLAFFVRQALLCS